MSAGTHGRWSRGGATAVDVATEFALLNCRGGWRLDLGHILAEPWAWTMSFGSKWATALYLGFLFLFCGVFFLIKWGCLLQGTGWN